VGTFLRHSVDKSRLL